MEKDDRAGTYLRGASKQSGILESPQGEVSDQEGVHFKRLSMYTGNVSPGSEEHEENHADNKSSRPGGRLVD